MSLAFEIEWCPINARWFGDRDSGDVHLDEGARLYLASEIETGALPCPHCKGTGKSEPYWMTDVERWSEECQCATCDGGGKLITAVQYLRTVPANWHEDSSLEKWFPLTAEELCRLKRNGAEAISGSERPPQVATALTALSHNCSCTSARVIGDYIALIERREGRWPSLE